MLAEDKEIIQLTFNYNPYAPEDTLEDIVIREDIIIKIREELFKYDSFNRYVKRPFRTGANTSVRLYGVGLDIELNNISYNCLYLGITTNKKFIYLFLEDSIKKFLVTDIFSFKVFSVEYNKYYFCNSKAKGYS